jgi:hypothetical protein
MCKQVTGFINQPLLIWLSGKAGVIAYSQGVFTIEKYAIALMWGKNQTELKELEC